MANLQKENELTEREIDHQTSLKGTFVSVMLLGLFIILAWSGVWMLYLSR
ncbi:MAG TPA: cytochrome c oxidase subunit 2A [Bacillota bacterium]|nr:cytochrome c oxidase subunit 2A [Bacillota bacterium]